MVGICCTPLCICMPPIHLYTPHTFVHPPYIHMAPRGVHTLQGPPMFLCSCMVLAHCMLWGVFFCFMCIGTHHPYLGVPPPLLHPPTLHCWFSVHFYSQGYQFLCGPFSPSIEGFGGVPPITGGGWGDTSVAVHMLILLHLFF